LWHVLVLGIVRLALDCDYDRIEYLVHYDKLMRQIMGLDSNFEGEFGKGFHQKTIQENICHIDEELIEKINTIVVIAGRNLFKKKTTEKINAKTDTYVLESNVHFPTDLNLLWDASRKCIQLMTRLCKRQQIVGWRKSKDWQKDLKIKMRICWQIQRSGGQNKAERVEKSVIDYTQKAHELNLKVKEGLVLLRQSGLGILELAEVIQIEYFQKMLIKHIDLIERRLIKGEVIPHEEKVFSLFEPYTHWINKGKSHPSVELGRKILLTTDQYDLILHHKVMAQSVDKNETLSEMDALFKLYGEHAFDSISFDKGFSCKEDREMLELFIPNVIMPKKGRLNLEDKDREGTKKFKLLRNKHSAIESNINMLEHHGLNRCPDKSFKGFKRYAGLGVLAYNCHKIGNKLFEKEKWKRLKKAA